MSDTRPDAKPRQGTREAAAEEVAKALEGMSVAELRQVVRAAEALIERKAEDEKRLLKEEIERRAADLGLTVRDLFGEPVQAAARGRAKPSRKGEGKEVAPRYRGPDGEAWSGRGRMPRWLQAALSEGKTKDDFLIK